MKSRLLIKFFLFLFPLAFIIQLPLIGMGLKGQGNFDVSEISYKYIEYNNLILKNISTKIEKNKASVATDLSIEPLSTVENNMARNLDSHWVWQENTLEMIDSYSPFLFRTKKSSSTDEVKVLLQVNSKGELSGFEIIGEVDKGLKERIDYVLRKLPDCKPVPGYTNYTPETFELIIKK
jgi:hypothetical protein